MTTPAQKPRESAAVTHYRSKHNSRASFLSVEHHECTVDFLAGFDAGYEEAKSEVSPERDAVYEEMLENFKDRKRHRNCPADCACFICSVIAKAESLKAKG